MVRELTIEEGEVERRKKSLEGENFFGLFKKIGNFRDFYSKEFSDKNCFSHNFLKSRDLERRMVWVFF